MKITKAPERWDCTLCNTGEHPALFKVAGFGGICKEAWDAIRAMPEPKEDRYIVRQWNPYDINDFDVYDSKRETCVTTSVLTKPQVEAIANLLNEMEEE